ncbi:uncharacterized protein TNCV_4998541 [Trichonephila clavipes]|nr:uncharacterized protein TNCV_4998541 [Trichonephila clavipes]
MVSWEYLCPLLRCRWEAGVIPLLSIGWWYLSSVSPKRHCCRVSAADKVCRVYPLDPRPDAVALYSALVLYSGCTPGKRRAWFLPDDRHTASLVGLRGRWRYARMKFSTRIIDKTATHVQFLLLSLPNNAMSQKSPFTIQKALIAIGGEPISVKPLCSGDLLIETISALQTKSFLLMKTFLDLSISVSPHKSLNICRGVISKPDLLRIPDAEILEGFSDQAVIQPDTLIVRFAHTFRILCAALSAIASASSAQADLLTSSSSIAAISESKSVNPIPNNAPSTSNISAFPSNSVVQPTSASASMQDTKLKAKT